MKLLKPTKQKGIALMWVLILSFVLMVITTTMVTYMVKENRMSLGIQDSTQSYAYARTGIDWGMARIVSMKSGETVSQGLNLDMDTGTPPILETNVVITATADGEGKIVSTSDWQGVKRTIEFEKKPITFAEVTPSDDNLLTGRHLPGNNGSFRLGFDFWTNQNNPSPMWFGLASESDSGGSYIALHFSGSYANIEVKKDGGPSASLAAISNTIPTTPAFTYSGSNESYADYRAEIIYVKDTSVNVVIKKRDMGTGVYNCYASGTLDMQEHSLNDLGSLDYFYVKNSVGDFQYLKTSGTIADGSYLQYRSGGLPIVFVDNIIVYDRSYSQLYDLRVSSFGGGTVTPDVITASYGTVVPKEELVATPNSGWKISGWSGDCSGSGTSPDADIVLSQNRSCRVTFEQIIETVTIGTQTWMKYNLNSGSFVTSGTNISYSDTVLNKYCYNNDPNLCATYGGLYLRKEMLSSSFNYNGNNICPIGFAIPTDNQWKTLESFLGMDSYEVGLTGWRSTGSVGADLRSSIFGFLAPLGGYVSGGTFYSTESGVAVGRYWTKTSYDPTGYYFMRKLRSGNNGVYRGTDENLFSGVEDAYSIRCIKTP